MTTTVSRQMNYTMFGGGTYTETQSGGGTLEAQTAADSETLRLAWGDKYLTQDWGSTASYSESGTFLLPGVSHVVSNVNDLVAYQREGSNVSYGVDSQGYIVKYTYSSAASISIPSSYRGGLRYITSKEVQGFRLAFSIAGLYGIDRSTGYISASVGISIFYRPYTTADSTAPWTVAQRSYVVSDKTRSEIIRWFECSMKEQAPQKYEILLVRNTPDHTSSFDVVDTITLKEVTEINYQSLKYNNTALLGLKIRATDQLSGQLPTITTLVKGLKVSVPDNCVSTDSNGNPVYSRSYSSTWGGTLHSTKVWTDNPVWCLYDLLTNTRYGLGDYYKISEEKHGMMLANFVLMARHCDETISYVDELGQSKTRPRFTLNIVIDQSKSAAEWIATIAATMRANVYYNEGIFWLDIDREKYVSQIFNMSNIKDYSQTGTSYRNIPNTYEVQWVNPDIGYEVDVFRIESDEVQLNQHIEERKKALLLIGVTNFDQAKSLAKFAMLAGKHRTKFVTFKTGTQGLRSMVGDVIGIQHDVPKWGWGGRVASVTNNGNSTYTLGLSSNFEFSTDYVANGKSLQLVITKNGAQAVTLTVSPPSSNGDYNYAIVSSAYTNQDGTTGTNFFSTHTDSDVYTYVIGAATNAINTFRIVSIKRDTDEVVEINAVEYDDQIFKLADDTSSLGAWAVKNYSFLSNPTRCSVTGLFVNPKTYQDTSGNWKVGVEVFYDIPQSSFWKGAEIHYNIDGSSSYTDVAGTDTAGYFFIPELTQAGDYQFVITSIYASGKQSISDALNDEDAHPWAYSHIDMYIPNDSFMGGVNGLCIENKANDGTFTGKDCIIIWNAPLAVDAAVPSTTSDTAGGTSTSDWLRDYKVEIWNMDGSIRRSVYVTLNKYTYTHEMNYEDGNSSAEREFMVQVYAVDRIGRISLPASIVCKNPAPAMVA